MESEMIDLLYFCLIYYGTLAMLTGFINMWHATANSKDAIEARYQKYRRVNAALVPAGIDELLNS